jgi:hypothetical protein
MKFGSKGLTFAWPVWTLFRRHLAFIGRDNTLHLQETALVIEGDLVRFSLPVLDMFVKRAFADRTMVTIPYSRIIRLKRARYVVAKVLWWLLAAAVFAWVAAAAADPRDLVGTVYYLSLVGCLFMLAGYLVHRFLASRHVLLFRRADGKRCVVCFSLKSSKRRRQFAEVLQANRDAALSLASPPPGAGPPGRAFTTVA